MADSEIIGKIHNSALDETDIIDLVASWVPFF